MARRAPPTGDEQLAAGACGDVLQMLDSRIVGVSTEAVLLVVGGAEEIVTERLNSQDAGYACQSQTHRVDREVARLQTVGERHPNEIAEGKHEAKAVGCNVDRCEDGGLHIEGVEDIEGLEGGNEEHRVADRAIGSILVGNEGEIHDYPAEEARAHLTPDFQVNSTKYREIHARVQFTSDEPVVDQIATMTTRCQLAVLQVA